MNQQNNNRLANMSIHNEEPLRSDKRPLNKKVFTKFIRVPTSKISKIFKKHNLNSLTFASSQFKSILNPPKSNNAHIKIEQSNSKQQQQCIGQQSQAIEVIGQNHQDVKQSLIQYLKDQIQADQSPQVIHSSDENDQSTCLQVDQPILLPHNKKCQQNIPQTIKKSTLQSYLSPHQQQTTHQEHYQTNLNMQPTHDDPNDQLPLPKAIHQQNHHKGNYSLTPSKQPAHPNSQTFNSQTFNTPKQKQSNFVYMKFQSLFARTIPEEFDEESSKSIVSNSMHSEVDKNEQLEDINSQWRRLSVKSLHIRNQTQSITEQGLVLKSNLNSKLSHSPSPTQATSHPHNSIIQKPQPQKIKNNDKKQHQNLIYVEEEYENGGKYCGYMKDKQRNGFGRFFYKNGGYYEGMWKNNAMNGQGILFYDNGRVAYDGQWYQSEFHGKGKVYNDSAKQMTEYFDYRDFTQNIENYWQHYEGELSHDTKVGYGKIFMSNGEYFEGTFSNDNVHGQGKFYSFRNEGQVVRGVWNHGILVKVLEIIPKRKIQFVNERISQQNKVPDDESQLSCQQDYKSVETVILPDEQNDQTENSKKTIEQVKKEYDGQSERESQIMQENELEMPDQDEEQREINSIREMGTIAVSQDIDLNQFGDL